MKFFMALAVLIAAPAWAGIGPASTGPFVVVDDNGKVVGGIVTSIDWANGDNHVSVALNTSEGMGFIYIRGQIGPIEDRISLTEFLPVTTAYYATIDCSGVPLGVDAGHGMSNPSGPLLVVIPDAQATVYTADLDTVTEMTPGSSLDQEGGCYTVSSPRDVRPVIASVGQLLVEFTPPFSIVPASSVQAASVPMLGSWGHWLLVAVLVLAFGAYDRARRRARVSA